MDMTVNQLLRPGERIDDLQRENRSSLQQCGLRIIQDPSRFCFGMDAVLLAAYVQMKKARRGLDQPASADLAKRSVALNGLQDRISIVQGDIREADRIFAAASFDFITCNPPYRTIGSGRVSGKADQDKKSAPDTAGAQHGGCGEDTDGDPASITAGPDRDSCGEDPTRGLDPRAIARHELLCTFEDVAGAAAKLLRPGGHFYLVHRPLRLPELITTLCGRGLEPKRMRLVYPHADQAPNMVLLDCVRGGAPELRVEPPLIVYEKDGTYTPELLQIYYS